ncbi:MAG: hypothetical protein ABEN55_20885 [Bradymonadaceae bacterium]
MRQGNWRDIGVAAMVVAIVGLTAAPAAAQIRESSGHEQQDDSRGFDEQEDSGGFLNIVPETLPVDFEELIVRVDDDEEHQLEIEYEVETDDWQRLQRKNIQLWLEIWVPIALDYRFSPFPRLRDVRAIDQPRGMITYPFWIDVDPDNLVSLCPVARTVISDPKKIVAWTCGGGPKDFRPRSEWGPELSVGTTFRLGRDDVALGLAKWYWVTPYRWLVFPRPLPTMPPPGLPVGGWP